MKITYKIAAVALMLGFAVQANAQNNADASATATVVSPIALTKSVDMTFGTIAPDGVDASTVVLATDGTLSSADGAQIIGAGGAAAEFTVSGDDLAYSITLPSTDLTLSDGAGGSMTVNGFLDSKSGESDIVSGADSFTVGATLNMDATEAAGTYTGTFNVSVDYN